MEKLAYFVKRRFPVLFPLMEAVAKQLVGLRFGRRLKAAEQIAEIEGTIAGQPATIRPLGRGDAGDLCNFLKFQAPDRLEYFRPHPFDYSSLEGVLASLGFLNYGLYVGDRLLGYALLRIAPTGSAFVGLLIDTELRGKGAGKFLVSYLYWQASIAGLRTRSTISRHNASSLRAHQAVADYKVVAELPNDYIMIEFPHGQAEKPSLDLP